MFENTHGRLSQCRKISNAGADQSSRSHGAVLLALRGTQAQRIHSYKTIPDLIVPTTLSISSTARASRTFYEKVIEVTGDADAYVQGLADVCFIKESFATRYD
jgi:hypothetical protein